jgi:hypothetical protein
LEASGGSCRWQHRHRQGQRVSGRWEQGGRDMCPAMSASGAMAARRAEVSRWWIGPV